MEELKFIKDELAYEREESLKSLLGMLETKPIPKEVFFAKRFLFSVINAKRSKESMASMNLAQRWSIRQPTIIRVPVIKVPVQRLNLREEKPMPHIKAEVQQQEIKANIPMPPEIPHEEEKELLVKIAPNQEYGVIFSSNQALARAYYGIEEGKIKYHLIEPHVDGKVLAKTIELLGKKLKTDVNMMKDDNALKKKIEKACKRYNVEFTNEYFEKVKYFIYRDYLRFGKVDPLLMDENISSVICEGVNKPLTVVFGGQKLETNVVFNSNEEINKLLFKFANISGVELNESKPMMTMIVGNLRIEAMLGIEEISSRFMITKEKTI